MTDVSHYLYQFNTQYSRDGGRFIYDNINRYVDDLVSNKLNTKAFMNIIEWYGGIFKSIELCQDEYGYFTFNEDWDKNYKIMASIILSKYIKDFNDSDSDNSDSDG